VKKEKSKPMSKRRLINVNIQSGPKSKPLSFSYIFIKYWLIFKIILLARPAVKKKWRYSQI